MGFFLALFGLFGFGFGVGAGLIIGYFLFIFWQPREVKDPIIKPLGELDSKTLQSLLPEIPIWVRNPDYDRVDWLNKFVKDLWPYLDKAICKIIKETTQPLIEQYSSRYTIDSIDFECLTLGTLAPTLQGIKAFDTQESEIMIEPVLKWAGNPNILVVVKAFGLKATVQLLDLQVFGRARVTCKPLIPTFPCFSKIIISLMEKPHIDFGLKLLGGDVMAIPGLYGFIQDLIKEEIAKLYLWPKTLEIAILDESKASVKKPVGIVIVKVLDAKSLKKADVLGHADPFVKMSVSASAMSKKTTVKKNTLNPVWNETHTLLVEDPSTQTLEFQVFDREKVSSHDKLGMQVVPLFSLTPKEPKLLTLNLRKNMDDSDPSNQKERGQLTVEVTYKPFRKEEDSQDEMEEKPPEGTPKGGGLLVVVVHNAEDLECKHHMNSFAKVVYKGQEFKTKPVKKSRDPRWPDGKFEIICDEPPMNDTIRIEVMNKGSGFGLHFKESLGYVEINLADVVKNKRINEEFMLIDSESGKVHAELSWLPS